MFVTDFVQSDLREIISRAKELGAGDPQRRMSLCYYLPPYDAALLAQVLALGWDDKRDIALVIQALIEFCAMKGESAYVLTTAKKRPRSRLRKLLK